MTESNHRDRIKTQSIKLLSYNIHRCTGLCRKQNIGRIASVIRDLQPDIVALQEVENHLGSRPESKQLSFLARRTGLTPVAGPTLFRENSDYGNAILARLPIQSIRRHDLSFSNKEPRGAIDVELSLCDKTLRVIGTHLGLKSGERHFQLNRLKNILRTSDTRPVILMGDMNEWFPFGESVRFFHSYFGASPLRRTFPAIFPIFPLDRIFISPNRLLRNVQAVRNLQARIASDHLPLLATLEL